MEAGSSSSSTPAAPGNVSWITRNVGVRLIGGNSYIAVLSPKNSNNKAAITGVIRRFGLLVKSHVVSTNIQKDIDTFHVYDAREDLWEAIPVEQKCKMAAQEIERVVLGS